MEAMKITKYYNCKVTEYAHSTKISMYARKLHYTEIIPEEKIDNGKPDDTGQSRIPDSPETNTAEGGQDVAVTEKQFTRTRTQEEEEHSLRTSLNRTKNMIYDLAKSNDWEWFITLTFDPKKYDSSNYDKVTSLLKRFIDNVRHNQSRGLVYLIVPELHADGMKFHFHGFLSDTGFMKFIPSGKLDSDGNDIFNIPAWKYGFSTASAIKDTVRASAYITKYITKEFIQHTKHKKRYYASRNIRRPEVSKLNISSTLEDIIDIYQPDHIRSLHMPHAYNIVTHMEVDD